MREQPRKPFFCSLLETGVSAEVNGLCVHSLRATAAPNALSHEADIAKGQEWLGHANVSTTRLYDRHKSKPEDSATFRMRYSGCGEKIGLFPVSTMCARSVMRSISALHSPAFGNDLGPLRERSFFSGAFSDNWLTGIIPFGLTGNHYGSLSEPVAEWFHTPSDPSNTKRVIDCRNSFARSVEHVHGVKRHHQAPFL